MTQYLTNHVLQPFLKTLIYDKRTIQRKTQMKQHKISEILLGVQVICSKLKEKETVIKMTNGYIASDFSLLPNDTI